MRINLNQTAQTPVENGRSSSASSANAEVSTAASSVLGEDQAQLSGIHAQVQTLVAQAAQLPEVRQEKVNALRQVVLSGAYHPAASQIADAVFNHMLVQPAA